MDRLFFAWARLRSASAVMLNLKTADVDALWWIDRRDGVGPTQLSVLLNMSTGGTSAVIDRLVEAGYAARVERREGQRRTAVVATVAGRAVIADQWAGLRAALDAIGATVPIDGRFVVDETVAAIVAAAEQHADAMQVSAREARALASRVDREPTIPWG